MDGYKQIASRSLKSLVLLEAYEQLTSSGDRIHLFSGEKILSYFECSP